MFSISKSVVAGAWTDKKPLQEVEGRNPALDASPEATSYSGFLRSAFRNVLQTKLSAPVGGVEEQANVIKPCKQGTVRVINQRTAGHAKKGVTAIRTADSWQADGQTDFWHARRQIDCKDRLLVRTMGRLPKTPANGLLPTK